MYNIKFDHDMNHYDTDILSQRRKIILSSIVYMYCWATIWREETAGVVTWGNEIGSSIILL